MKFKHKISKNKNYEIRKEKKKQFNKHKRLLVKNKSQNENHCTNYN